MATSTVDHVKGRRTTVALKIAMAVTGLFFVLFLLMHMYGNLKMFVGAEAYDGYAHWMRTILYPVLPHEGTLWVLRFVLLASVLIHAYAAIKLWARAGGARGQAYKVNAGKKVTFSHSYTGSLMRWGGIALAFFIVFHILQFTSLHVNAIGGTHADYVAMGPYHRMLGSFQMENWWVYVVYLIAIAALSFHIHHGVWSALATLGLSRTSREKAYKVVANLAALAVFVGFMTPPTAILFGIIS
ncbi:succinate dehydrogenase cytochrome b subunit [Trueperella pecoris]|nr:succinate dehydrogenase cytochrome b subunit [Trueperella pecoris]